MTLAVEDIINEALRAGGVPLRIADIYEGSEAAKIALEIYGQARDELIVDPVHDWSFPRRTAGLTLLKGPPPAGGFNLTQYWTSLYPAPGFLFEYAYPSDCLDLRAITEPPSQMPDCDPIPQPWRVDNDPTPIVSGGVATGPAAKVIMCQVNQAVAIYMAQVTDPNEWDTLFHTTLVASLAQKFARAFGADANTIKSLSEETTMAGNAADLIRG